LKANYSLFSISGEKINSENFTGKTTINMKSLKSGIYFLHIDTSAEKMIHKILKN